MWAYVLGGLCLFYFAGILLFGRVGTNFYLVWGALGVFFLTLGVLIRTGWTARHLPIFVRRSALLLFLLFTVLFAAVELLIVSGFFSRGKPHLDYVIVLGALVREDGPSRAVAMRLDCACRYAEQNPDTIVIVSGGQGGNEPAAESAVMKRYLEEKGIAPERILEEDRSHNTRQNLIYSWRMLREREAQAGREEDAVSVGIVSSNFHIFRAAGIARKLGIPNVCGIAAPAPLSMQASNMLREFFGILKDYLTGWL